MQNESLTEAQLAATITSLLADVAQTIDDVPGLLDPTAQRHGRRRKDAVLGPGQQRRLLQLQLAQAALAVAQAAVEEPAALPALAERVAVLQRHLADLQRLGHGVIEVREVARPRLVETRDPATGAVTLTMGKRACGPYAYYRWSEGDKLRSLYLGRADQPASWLWKLEALGADLVALGLAAEMGFVRGINEIQDYSNNGG